MEAETEEPVTLTILPLSLEEGRDLSSRQVS